MRPLLNLLRVNDTICRHVRIYSLKNIGARYVRRVIPVVVRLGTQTSFGLIDLWQVYYVFVEIHRRTYKWIHFR